MSKQILLIPIGLSLVVLGVILATNTTYIWMPSVGGLLVLFGMVGFMIGLAADGDDEWSEKTTKKAALQNDSEFARNARIMQAYWKGRTSVEISNRTPHKDRCRYCNTRITDQKSTNCERCGAPL